MIWSNWARTASCSPAGRAAPGSEAELADVVARSAAAGRSVRAAGGGHSFTPAATTSGVLLSLDRLDALERVEPLPGTGNALVTVGAGIRLHQLNRLLAGRGLALENLGDIDRQSIAGAISTGTHGTGAGFGGLAAQVRGLRVVGTDGAVHDVGPGDPLFEASRLGLGTTGIIAAVTLEAVPAYDLLAEERPAPLAEVLESLDGPDGVVATSDHFEFYFFPATGRALTLRNTRVAPGAPGRLERAGRAARSFLDEEVLSNGAFEALNQVATAFGSLTPRLNAVSARALSPRTYQAPSHQVFCTRRRVRFREMEYAIPRELAGEVVAEVDAWLRRSGENVPFPVEVRFTAPDDVWLSTAYRRETAYVAVHQYWRLPYSRYFEAAERIFVTAGGRPHWGKLHTRDADDLAPLYPRFDDAARVRLEHDPEGVLMNRYTRKVLG
ncbi:D-arabinono-1,4-lactone oxidase [Myceligenerans crystallogenes]|uniref:D-arabinono-1,4-lactone oxidase n=1 Tax=Myceligenerans crystallogenes TaxID=316335 RepID=UPI003CD07BF9